MTNIRPANLALSVSQGVSQPPSTQALAPSASPSAPNASQAPGAQNYSDRFEGSPVLHLSALKQPQTDFEIRREKALTEILYGFDSIDRAASRVGQTDGGISPRDGVITRAELEAIATSGNNPYFGPSIRDACQFFLADPLFSGCERFDKNDIQCALSYGNKPCFESNLKHAITQIEQNFECFGAGNGSIGMGHLLAAVKDPNMPAGLRHACQFFIDRPQLTPPSVSKGDVAAILAAMSGTPAGSVAPTTTTPPAGSVSATTAPVRTGLGAEIDKLMALSPSMQADLKQLENAGWTIKYGTAGAGSSATIDKKEIVIDPDLRKNPKEAVQVLAHEVGHAIYGKNLDTSSKKTFMDSVLDQEGAATLSNIRIQREIKANGGGNIGIAGTMGPHYEAIYDQYMNGEIDEATARKKIGDIFANNERTSGSGGTQTYRQHYETLYDEWARQRR